jgi:hypothetical protein
MTTSVLEPTSSAEPETLDGFTQEEFDAIIQGKSRDGKSKNKYTPQEFQDAADFLLYFDPALHNEHKHLHNWQRETLEFLSDDIFPFSCPLQFSLVTCNGSGKDAYIIAGLALFLTLHKIRHRCVITTASYKQLKNQTQNYIRTLGNTINARLEELGNSKQALLIKKDHIVCTTTGSEIVMFVTDEPGNAEGYHPFPDYHKAELTIITNEAKSVPDDIFGALRRCTYNRWIEVSSTGKTSGHFFQLVHRSRQWKEGFEPGIPYQRTITCYDCPHISIAKIEDAKIELGETSPLFRSMFLAQFVSVDEAVVMEREKVDHYFANPPERFTLGIGRRAGLDLSASAGGDENTFYILEENEVIGAECWHSSDPMLTAKISIELFQKWNLSADNIFADDGGVGRAITARIWELGWHINKVNNQSTAVFKSAYGNRGAEMWFNFANIARYIIFPKNDAKLADQLSQRGYKQHDTLGKLILKSKASERAEGKASPDRADALVLATCGLNVRDFMGGKVDPKNKSKTEKFLTEFLRDFNRDPDSYLQKIPRFSKEIQQYSGNVMRPSEMYMPSLLVREGLKHQRGGRKVKRLGCSNPISILRNL